MGTLSLFEPHFRDTCEYIAEHYDKHCISATLFDPELKILNIVPVKIVSHVDDLEQNLQHCKYISGVQYIHVCIEQPEESMRNGWDKYQDIFDQCLNLKAIELTWMGRYRATAAALSQVSAANQTIWNERISYFKARGIRIVDGGEIYNNENLQTKLAKEAGVTWKFCFY